LLVILTGWASGAYAVSSETSNGCRETEEDPCLRSGTCEIQGSVWSQVVTIDRSDIFDTQGWPGLCDMVHVGLVQGDCEPAGGQVEVSVRLSATTTAWLPAIEGSLVCAGEPEPPVPPEVPGLGVPGRMLLMWVLLSLGLSWSLRRDPRE
jgi:hypothetical protein